MEGSTNVWRTPRNYFIFLYRLIFCILLLFVRMWGNNNDTHAQLGSHLEANCDSDLQEVDVPDNSVD